MFNCNPLSMCCSLCSLLVPSYSGTVKAHTALKIMFSYFSLFFTYIMLLRNFNSWILLRPLPVPLVNCAVKNKTQIL